MKALEAATLEGAVKGAEAEAEAAEEASKCC
jgi:hypothetical protein